MKVFIPVAHSKHTTYSSNSNKILLCLSCDCDVSLPPAPIGSVEVSIICSSSGAMGVFCSSDGDQLLYSWTLNGDPLMDGNSSIDLDERTDGNIICSVKNHVSHAQKTIRLEPCPAGELLIYKCPDTVYITTTATPMTKNSQFS